MFIVEFNPITMFKTKIVHWMIFLFIVETKNAPIGSIFGAFRRLPWSLGMHPFRVNLFS